MSTPIYPFQFSRYVRERRKGGSFVASSSGCTVTDLDGNQFYDLTGSYDVNVFGNDFYKACIDSGNAHARALGPVSGANLPCTLDDARRLCSISGLDEVSFHMSGTEAVMQAVRLARYHTRRRYLVRFCGAYHGWWGEVQPGVGNPATARNAYGSRRSTHPPCSPASSTVTTSPHTWPLPTSWYSQAGPIPSVW